MPPPCHQASKGFKADRSRRAALPFEFDVTRVPLTSQGSATGLKAATARCKEEHTTMNAAMVVAITAALVPYVSLPASAAAGCCGGAALPEWAPVLLDVLANMRDRLPPGVVSNEDVGCYAMNIKTPHLKAGVHLNAAFWDVARQTKAVIDDEVGSNSSHLCICARSIIATTDSHTPGPTYRF